MNMKLTLTVVTLVACICIAHARHVPHHEQHGAAEPASADRRPAHAAAFRAVSHKQGKQARVFPGAVAIKKLVLLKFKKIIPISLILLKSSNENEAELVPVYPTAEIPSNVQFIPTPNGISGHKDVQAIAIPTEFHQQLELNGLANLEHIEALLNQAEPDANNSGDSTVTIVEPMGATGLKDDDQPLNVKEDDEDQLLEGVSIAAEPAKTNLRRLANDEIGRPVLRQGAAAAHHTTVEEIPLFLYSTKDTPQMVYGSGKRQQANRYVALRHQQHANY